MHAGERGHAVVPRRAVAPFALFFLHLPAGIATGFVSVALPFALTRAGFPVATTASVVAIGLAANTARFVWGPVVDLVATLRTWFAAGVAACAGGLLLLGWLPLAPRLAPALAGAAFVSLLAATLVSMALSAVVARAFDGERGRAAGWLQAGNVGGFGLGGGAAVWLADRLGFALAATAIAAATFAFVLGVRIVPAIPRALTGSIGRRLADTGRDLLDLLRSRTGLFTTAVFVSPIGVGGASFVWAAVAPGWHASADVVALASGVLSGVLTAAGAIAGGTLADRLGRWPAFFGSGAAVAVVGLLMAAAPRTPAWFVAGVLAYAFAMGVNYAVYLAVLIEVVGRRAASTRCGALGSVGNVPVSYMTAFDGWAHDLLGPGGMLNAEAAVALACVAIGWGVSRRLEAAPRDPAAVPAVEG